MARPPQESIPLGLEKGEELPPPTVTLLGRIKSFLHLISSKIDKQTAGYAGALAFVVVMFNLSSRLFYSDWLNPGQAEHRQLVTELGRPYLPRNREFSSLNWTHSTDTDACYLLLEGQFNFTGCHWSCFQARGLPASIHSSRENNFIWKLFKNSGKDTRAWFGLAEIDGKWTNQDNSKMDYTPGQWNKVNQLKKTNPNDFCAQMYTFDGNWMAADCQEKLSMCICKDYGVACPP